MNFKRLRNAIRGTKNKARATGQSARAGQTASPGNDSQTASPGNDSQTANTSRSNHPTQGCKIPTSLLEGDGATVYYAGDLTRGENCFLIDKILEESHEPNPVIAFEGDLKPKVEQFIHSMEGKAEFYHVPRKGGKGFVDFVCQYLYRNYGWCAKKAGEYYEREYGRIYGPYNIREIHFVNSEEFESMETILRCKCQRVVHQIPMNFYRKLIDVFHSHPKRKEEIFGRFDRRVEYEEDFGIEAWDRWYCNGIYARFRDMNFVVDGENIRMTARLDISPEDVDARLLEKIKITSTVHEKVFQYDMKIEGRKVTAVFPIEDVTGWYNINLPCLQVESFGRVLSVPVLVSKSRKTKVYEIGSSGYAFEVREDYRHLRFVIKEAKVTDRRGEKIKIALAFVLSLVTPWKKPIVLYEKYCRNYEESASILFERLIDEGYKDVKYILNSQSPAAEGIMPKYKRHIVDQFSFGHYYNLFAARSIFSSEALGHALEKGTANSLFKTFVLEGSKNYVFLQHGVMYMVSLSSEQRNFFRKGEGSGKERVVVSSQLEADHFTSSTNYEAEDIYKCGLIKLDRSLLREGADRILLMLTWRPWEFVTGIGAMEETAYYRMLRRIVRAVPQELKEKLIVMPHPLILDQVKQKQDDEVWKYFVDGRKYDDLLKDTKVLITDYSSISYDAFYRGSNVVFDWEEKDECMKEYGENGHLMLTEELAFGHVCYDDRTLSEAIASAYYNPQRENHRENFARIVEFHDGNNSGRFIEMAKKDGIL